MKTKIILAVFLASALGIVQTTQAQLLGIGGKKANTEFIPESAFAGAVVFPRKISEDPKFDLFPREIVTAWGQKELGFDPMLINQITFVVKKMDVLGQPPQWAAVLHFEKMQGLSGNLIGKLKQKNVGGKTMFSGTDQGMPSFLIFDESTMFVGDEDFFTDMVTADQKGKLVRLIKRAGVSGEIMAFADIESVRPVLNQATQMIPGIMPPAITKLRLIPDMIDAIEIGVKADGRIKTEIIVHTADADLAEEAGKIITEALDFGAEMGIGLMASQMDFNDPVQEALVEYAQRMADDYKQKLSPAVNGNKMSINLDEEATIVPVLIGLLLPAVQQTRAVVRRTASMNNSRQMVLALHNYASAHGKFPAQASYDKNGKPLLSWRVHILPWMEQQALYDQFHLDEPWDSRHNKKLIGKIPQSYQSPSVGDLNGKTVYLGVAGEGMMFTDEQRGFGDITDGSSNTALMVEVNPDHAVHWTQPQDWAPDERNPLKGLGGVNQGGFIVSFADGSVHFISNNVNPETWKALLTIGGGDVVGDF